MNDHRYLRLMWNGNEALTPDEIKEGWHFCWEFDGLLVGPGMGELKFCECNDGKPTCEPPKEETETINIDPFL